jgi:hypothetical protein
MKTLALTLFVLASFSSLSQAGIVPAELLCRIQAQQKALKQAQEDSADPENMPKNATITQVISAGKIYLVEVDGGAQYRVTTLISSDGNSCEALQAVAQ